ncbi:MAG: hypothetical protein ACRDYW_10540 [Acidimicrobiales bacterium]
MIGRPHVKRLANALDALRRAKTPTARLTAARRAREAAEKLEDAQLKAARDEGLTWAEIGRVYGLTKQGAQQRFRTGRKAD